MVGGGIYQREAFEGVVDGFQLYGVQWGREAWAMEKVPAARKVLPEARICRAVASTQLRQACKNIWPGMAHQQDLVDVPDHLLPK